MHGGHTDNLSEQVCQQIGMLVTIASGIAGGLAGNSTASAGTGPWRVRMRLKTIC
ncbi:VENN motif pre-toxin domain-containing protein [Escherichia coli]|uniref:VENN motif pre-toxin domain-containing protein n=1 Tax=Escherichia coli TaxID=562 RepID=A0A8S7NV44_ECOLX|nr:VENN motif pre-toxin domain-containing protein [Escherichia coli]EFB4078934.1 VENN motif pre-toxin domain-containing protein [Escherichia coli O91]EIH26517.1 putative hemagglutinin [Escherichia coli 1.2264]HDQ6866119.1 VENN motif pre-toxin domain-containing protein [Escherichia coli O176:H4]EES5164257.1 VENN motif pre-toxin domain-containing protein [Escherichia coli]